MGTYVVGDIHGYYEAWMSLKAKIEKQDPDARFILVGDIVDRGPNSLKMIRWAMENIKQNGRYQMVLGNHEDMKIEWWIRYQNRKRVNPKLTLADYEEEVYDFDKLIQKEGLTETEVDEIIAFFYSLPLVIEVDIPMKDKPLHYIVAHGELKEEFLTENGHFNQELLVDDIFEKEDSNKKRCRETLLWGRNFFGNYWNADTVFVHGHTPTNVRDLVVRGAAAGIIDFRAKDINVDCGIMMHDSERNLAAIRLEDLEEFYLMDVERNKVCLEGR